MSSPGYSGDEGEELQRRVVLQRFCRVEKAGGRRREGDDLASISTAGRSWRGRRGDPHFLRSIPGRFACSSEPRSQSRRSAWLASNFTHAPLPPLGMHRERGELRRAESG